MQRSSSPIFSGPGVSWRFIPAQTALLSFLLLVLQAIAAGDALADVWAYVDKSNTLHVSSVKKSPKYTLVVPGVKPESCDREVVRDPVSKNRGTDPDSKVRWLLENVINADYPTPKHRLTSKSIFTAACARQTCSKRKYSFPKVRNKGPIVKLINTVSSKHGVDRHLVYAVLETESNFFQYAVSPKGAKGLMQIMPETARCLGLTNPFDPGQNIDAGVRFLKMMLRRFRNVGLALAAYNAGPEAVERHKGIPPYNETQNYVARIMTRYRMLREK